MLIQTVAQRFEGRVQLRNEDFGASELAERFGIQRYPAVFVNDVLIAKPKDFGFFGETGSQGAGRYTPWLDEKSHAKFQGDLERAVRLALRGELEATGSDEPASADAGLAALPEFEAKDLLGETWNTARLREGVTIVEFWATWCPPCIKAMPWLVQLQKDHAKELQIVSIAVESKESDVRRFTEERELPFPTLTGTPELVRRFGDLTAVPTMFVFERGGRLAEVFYGAPPDLHTRVDALLRRLTEENGK